MTRYRLPALAGLLLAAASLPLLHAGTTPARAEDKCAPATLSTEVEARMKADDKTPEEIAGILDSGFKRGILAGRIEDGSGCSSDAVKAALDMLAKTYK